MDFRLRSLWEVVAIAERGNHAGGGPAGVVAEELPERSGVADGGLEADVGGLRPGGGEN